MKRDTIVTQIPIEVQKSIKTAITKHSVARNPFRSVFIIEFSLHIVFVSALEALNEKYLFFHAVNALSLTFL